MLTVLDIFSGIGGFSLGLERTGGFKTVAFCEIDPFCRKVLRKHWPDVPIFEDVTKLRGEDVGPVDVIAGGFPCQDISTAGRGEGIEGSRSGLWKEFARLIGEIRPRYVIVENVSALLGRGLDRVLGDLAALGFDAEWHCIPASAIGAPHRRDRIWMVAFAQHSDTDGAGSHREGMHEFGTVEPADEQERVAGSVGAVLADARRERGPTARRQRPASAGKGASARDQRSRSGGDDPRQIAVGSTGQNSSDVANASSEGFANIQGCGTHAWRNGYGATLSRCVGSREHDQWGSEPDVGRVAHGVPARVDRLRSLGNAVVPQVVELIGNAILESA